MNTETHNFVVGSGLFADLNRLLRIAYISLINNNSITVNWSSEFFPYKDDPKSNPFNEFFNIIEKINEDDIKNIKDFFSYALSDEYIFFIPKILEHYNITNQHKYCSNWNATTIIRKIKLTSDMNNEFSNIKRNHFQMLSKIFYTRFSINDKIIQDINNYYNDNMKNHYVIGVHIRVHNLHNNERNGEKIETDHDIINELDNFIQKNNIINYKIYIATDIKETLNIFINKYKENLLYNKENIWMSNHRNDSIEPHFGFETQDIKNQNNNNFKLLFNNKKPGLKGGIELLKDVLILSKCNVFRSSLSNLSDWIYIINPNINNIN